MTSGESHITAQIPNYQSDTGIEDTKESVREDPVREDPVREDADDAGSELTEMEKGGIDQVIEYSDVRPEADKTKQSTEMLDLNIGQDTFQCCCIMLSNQCRLKDLASRFSSLITSVESLDEK